MIYRDSTAINAVNKGQDVPDAFYHPEHPSEIIATSKWKSTDRWRGYNVLTPEPGYIKVDEDFATDDWDDAIAEVHGISAQNRKYKELAEKYGDIFIIYTPTSNVFSTGQDILARDPDYKPTPEDRGKVIAHKTRKFTSPDGSWRVRYHATDVVKYDPNKQPHYTLDTGGWNTVTTSKRMTDALPAGWYVYRRAWIMYVHTPAGDQELKDGMEV